MRKSEDRLEAILGWLENADKHDDEDTGVHYRVTLPEVLHQTLVSHLKRLREMADMKGSIALPDDPPMVPSVPISVADLTYMGGVACEVSDQDRCESCNACHVSRWARARLKENNVVNGAIQGTPAAMREAVAREGIAPLVEAQKPRPRKVCVIFDGPPGVPDETSGRFVEIEDESGNSVRVGSWRERGNGTWSLDLELAPPESAPYFKCPTCGPRVRADEDHCCVGCGADCTVVGDLTPGGTGMAGAKAERLRAEVAALERWCPRDVDGLLMVNGGIYVVGEDVPQIAAVTATPGDYKPLVDTLALHKAHRGHLGECRGYWHTDSMRRASRVDIETIVHEMHPDNLEEQLRLVEEIDTRRRAALAEKEEGSDGKA